MADQRLRIIYDAVDNTSKVVGNVTGSIKRNKDAIQSMGRQATIAGGAIIGLLGVTVKFGSDLAESINAVQVIFKGGADTILEFGKTASTSVGLAAADFNQLATQTGALLGGMGLTTEEVAQQTIELTKRASDLASVHNTDVKDALSAINQALRGETEAIRRYAADVTDATIEAFALGKGINKSVTEMTQQEKKLLRIAALMAQTSDVADDFVNTSGELANQVRISTAEMKNQAAAIGQVLLPVLKDILSQIMPILQGIGEWVKENPRLTAIIVKFAAAVGALLLVLGPLLIILPGLSVAFSLMLGPIGLLITLIAALGIAYATNIFGIRDKTKVVFDSLSKIYNSWVGWLLPSGPLIKGFIFLKNNWRGIIDSITKVAQTFINFYINNWVNPIIKGLNAIAGVFGKKLIEPLKEVKIATDKVGDAIKKNLRNWVDLASTAKDLAEAGDSVTKSQEGVARVTQEVLNKFITLNSETGKTITAYEDLGNMAAFVTASHEAENSALASASTHFNDLRLKIIAAREEEATLREEIEASIDPFQLFIDTLFETEGRLEFYQESVVLVTDAARILTEQEKALNDELERQEEAADAAAAAIKKLGDILKQSTQDINVINPPPPRPGGGFGGIPPVNLAELAKEQGLIPDPEGGNRFIETLTTEEADARGILTTEE